MEQKMYWLGRYKGDTQRCSIPLQPPITKKSRDNLNASGQNLLNCYHIYVMMLQQYQAPFRFLFFTKKQNAMMVVSLGFYSQEDYKLLLETATDRRIIDDEWQDWLINYHTTKSDLMKDYNFQEVYIDVRRMNEIFKSRNLTNNASNRAKYINEQGLMLHERMTNN